MVREPQLPFFRADSCSQKGRYQKYCGTCSLKCLTGYSATPVRPLQNFLSNHYQVEYTCSSTMCECVPGVFLNDNPPISLRANLAGCHACRLMPCQGLDTITHHNRCLNDPNYEVLVQEALQQVQEQVSTGYYKSFRAH